MPDGATTLHVLLVKRAGSYDAGTWALPGTFLHEGERLADAVLRSLRDKAGIQGTSPKQLHVFDDPNGDEADVKPDPHRLLPDEFTLLQLRRLHEAVQGRPLVKDTFRRAMRPHLQPTDRFSSGEVGKPARIYRHAT